MTNSAHAGSRATRPPHGTMAEEARKLAEVAQLWLAARSARDRAADAWSMATEDAAQPECTGCPVCRARRALAGVNPEVYQHLSDAAGSLAAALRALSKGADRT